MNAIDQFSGLGITLPGAGSGWLDRLSSTVSKVTPVVQNVRSTISNVRSGGAVALPGGTQINPALTVQQQQPAQTGMPMIAKVGIGLGVIALGVLAYKKFA